MGRLVLETKSPSVKYDTSTIDREVSRLQSLSNPGIQEFNVLSNLIIEFATLKINSLNLTGTKKKRNSLKRNAIQKTEARCQQARKNPYLLSFTKIYSDVKSIDTFNLSSF